MANNEVKPTYRPEVFHVKNLEHAKSIILTQKIRQPTKDGKRKHPISPMKHSRISDLARTRSSSITAAG